MAMSDGFWLGVLGGLFAEVFGLFKLRYLPRAARPLWVRSLWYWTRVTMTPLLAVNIGASAPLILQSLMSQAPPIEPGRVN